MGRLTESNLLCKKQGMELVGDSSVFHWLCVTAQIAAGLCLEATGMSGGPWLGSGALGIAQDGTGS